MAGGPPGRSHERHRGFCDRWAVEKLALFGSVLRDDFGPDSDIDCLVRFKGGTDARIVRNR